MSAPTVTSAPASSSGTGRPRDPRIDDAVLQATTELLEEVGYLQLTIGAIAERAGTNKPAIYRRWPTKAHLVHEAVFPAQSPEVIPPGDDLRSDIRALVAIGVELLGRPAARAALPGLLAEMTGDPTLQADVLGRFAGGAWGWLQQPARGRDRRRARCGPTCSPRRCSSSSPARRSSPPPSARWTRSARTGSSDVVDLIMRGIAP